MIWLGYVTLDKYIENDVIHSYATFSIYYLNICEMLLLWAFCLFSVQGNTRSLAKNILSAVTRAQFAVFVAIESSQ